MLFLVPVLTEAWVSGLARHIFPAISRRNQLEITILRFQVSHTLTWPTEKFLITQAGRVKELSCRDVCDL